MKKLLACLPLLFLAGCASDRPLSWKLLPTESAQVDYVGIIPLQSPDNGVVARLEAELKGIRRYEIAVTDNEFDREVRRLLDANRSCRLRVQNGVVTLVPPQGTKIMIGAEPPAAPQAAAVHTPPSEPAAPPK